MPQGFRNIIIIQNDPDYQEVWDSARKLSCDWVTRLEKTVTFAPFGVDMLGVKELRFPGDVVDCWMDIQRGHGPFAPSVGGVVPIGEKLTVTIYVRDSDGSFDVHVKDCYAYDTPDYRNPNAHAIKLTDENGCPVKEKLVQGFYRTRDVRDSGATIIAYGLINAFKFPEKMDVYLACNVEVCKGGCPDNHCQPQMTIASSGEASLVDSGVKAISSGKAGLPPTQGPDTSENDEDNKEPTDDNDEEDDDGNDAAKPAKSDSEEDEDKDEDESNGNGKNEDKDEDSNGDDEEKDEEESNGNGNGDEDEEKDSNGNGGDEEKDEEESNGNGSDDEDEEKSEENGNGNGNGKDEESENGNGSSEDGDDEEKDEEENDNGNGNGNGDENGNGKDDENGDDEDEEKDEENGNGNGNGSAENGDEDKSEENGNGNGNGNAISTKGGDEQTKETDEQSKEKDEDEQFDEDEETEEERKKRKISASLKSKAKSKRYFSYANSLKLIFYS